MSILWVTEHEKELLPAMLPTSERGSQWINVDLPGIKKPRFRGFGAFQWISLDLLNLLIGGDGGN